MIKGLLKTLDGPCFMVGRLPQLPARVAVVVDFRPSVWWWPLHRIRTVCLTCAEAEKLACELHDAAVGGRRHDDENV